MSPVVVEPVGPIEHRIRALCRRGNGQPADDDRGRQRGARCELSDLHGLPPLSRQSGIYARWAGAEADWRPHLASSIRLTTLPVGFRGSSSTNTTSRGTLNLASRPLT